jgi:hypothetical protein
MAPKILCTRRKQKACLAAPDVCIWENDTCKYKEKVMAAQTSDIGSELLKVIMQYVPPIMKHDEWYGMEIHFTGKSGTTTMLFSQRSAPSLSVQHNKRVNITQYYVNYIKGGEVASLELALNKLNSKDIDSVEIKFVYNNKITGEDILNAKKAILNVYMPHMDTILGFFGKPNHASLATMHLLCDCLNYASNEKTWFESDDGTGRYVIVRPIFNMELILKKYNNVIRTVPFPIDMRTPEVRDYLQQHNLKLLAREPVPNNVAHHMHHEQDIYRSAPNIRNAYVANVGSAELNVSLIYFQNERERFPDDLQTRMLTILNEYDYIHKLDKRYNKPVVVYHGASQPIHVQSTFVTCAFLSTTQSPNVARAYAGSKTGVVYVLQLPEQFPFINFQDKYQQVLLPIGTTVRVVNVDRFGSYTYFTCTVDVYDRNITSLFIDILQKPCFETYEVQFPDTLEHSSLHILAPNEVYSMKKHVANGSSNFYKGKLNGERTFIKEVTKAKGKIRMLKNINQTFKRSLNEVMASRIYSQVYGMPTLDLKLIYNKYAGQFPTILVGSKFVKLKYTHFTYPRQTEAMKAIVAYSFDILSGFLVDCVMANWDVYNNDNIGFGDDGVLKRTDVGGCLMYRGLGDENLQFAMHNEPNDHILMMHQEMFQKHLSIVKTKSVRADLEKAMIHTIKGIRDFDKKIDEVSEDMKRLVAPLPHKAKYIKMIDTIVDTVKYRHEYYINLTNDTTIMSRISGQTTTQNGGGDEMNAADSKVSSRIIKKIEGEPMANPVSTKTPGEFKRMLEGLKRKCKD